MGDAVCFCLPPTLSDRPDRVLYKPRFRPEKRQRHPNLTDWGVKFFSRFGQPDTRLINSPLNPNTTWSLASKSNCNPSPMKYDRSCGMSVGLSWKLGADVPGQFAS